MRSKTPLALMEQVVMVLVFSLAAAVCLQVFVFSDKLSLRNEAVDRAVTECQTVAEALKATGGEVSHAQTTAASMLGGTVSQGVWRICYDKQWDVTNDEADWVYALETRAASELANGLCGAEIQAVRAGESEPLFSVTVFWQEVGSNA